MAKKYFCWDFFGVQEQEKREFREKKSKNGRPEKFRFFQKCENSNKKEKKTEKNIFKTFFILCFSFLSFSKKKMMKSFQTNFSTLKEIFRKKFRKKFFFHRNTAKDIFDDFRQKKIKKKIMMLSKFKI